MALLLDGVEPSILMDFTLFPGAKTVETMDTAKCLILIKLSVSKAITTKWTITSGAKM